MCKKRKFVFLLVLSLVLIFGTIPAFAAEAERSEQPTSGQEAYEGEPPLMDGDEDSSDSRQVKSVKAAAGNGARSGRSSVAKMTMEEVRNLYDEISWYESLYKKAPVVSGANYSPAVLSDEAMASGLGWMNYYRTVAGLTSVSFSDEANLQASYGALCLAMLNDGLSHTPPQTADMSDDDYDTAYAATSSSNLSARFGYSENSILGGSISGQMCDSSVSNMFVLGHRRWLLDPRMLTSGIGAADNGGWYYVDVKVFGAGVSKNYSVNDYDFIAWPASGKNLTETFPADTPWSVTLNPNLYASPDIEKVQVTLKRINDGKTWVFNNSIDSGYSADKMHFFVDNNGYGIDNCIVFRPSYDDISAHVGNYEVTITGITDRSGNAKSLSYTVDFAPFESDLSNYSVSLGNTAWSYTGKSICPDVTVIAASTALIEGTDYTVSYSNNVNPGTAKAIVKGIGDYSGTVELEFTITKSEFISFDANGGSDAPDYVLLENGKAEIPLQVPTLDRKNFAGWAESANAGKPKYQPGDVISSNQGIVLYAVWYDPYEIIDGVEQTANVYAGSGVWYHFVPEYSCNYRITLAGGGKIQLKIGGRTITWTVGSCGMSELELLSQDTEVFVYVSLADSTQTGKLTFSFALEHSPVTTIEAKEATCTEDGYTAELACSVCGEVFQHSEVIPATGHSWSAPAYVWSSDNSTVTASRQCQNDASHVETEEAAAAREIREASCTEAGMITYTAAFKNAAFTTQTKTEVIPAQGHQFGDWISAGDENHKRTCPACGTEETEAHIWGEPYVIKEATEDEEGIRGYTCTVCEHEKTEVIPKTDHVHSYIDTVAEPTCTEQGYTIHKCEKCGDEYRDTFVDALGHDWDEGTVIKEATTEEEGEMLYTCRRLCGETRTERIPKISPIQATDIYFLSTSGEWAPNSEFLLAAHIEPEDAGDYTISWSSSNPIVAEVDEGMVRVKAYGTAVITATLKSGSLTKTASYEVKALFSDVKDAKQYYFTPVYWAAGHDPVITAGYANGSFGVGKNCARRELMIFMWRYAGCPTQDKNGAAYGDARTMFSDMNAYDVSTATNQAVAWAYKEGIAKGYSDGGFHPTASIVRKDVMIMLYRLAGKPAVSGTLKFPDCQSFKKSSDTYKAILWGSNNKITNGYNSGPYKGQFGVNLNCLREQIVTFLYRYSEL